MCVFLFQFDGVMQPSNHPPLGMRLLIRSSVMQHHIRIRIEPCLVAKWACFIVRYMKKYSIFTPAIQTVWNLILCIATDISKSTCI
jgi:hypothetical protein